VATLGITSVEPIKRRKLSCHTSAMGRHGQSWAAMGSHGPRPPDCGNARPSKLHHLRPILGAASYGHGHGHKAPAIGTVRAAYGHARITTRIGWRGQRRGGRVSHLERVLTLLAAALA